MYLPEVDRQLAFVNPGANLSLEGFPEDLLSPNVTKGINDILQMCDTAGLDPQGFGCGLSVHSQTAIMLIIDCVCVDDCSGASLCYCRCGYSCYHWYSFSINMGITGRPRSRYCQCRRSCDSCFNRWDRSINSRIFCCCYGGVKCDRADHCKDHLSSIQALSCRPRPSFSVRYFPDNVQLMFDAPEVVGDAVVNGQIRYVREPIDRPPSYHSDDENSSPISGRK